MTYRIEKATREDVKDIAAIFWLFYEEVENVKELGYNVKDCLEFLNTYIEDPNWSFLLLKHGEYTVGTVLGSAVSIPWNKENIIGHEFCWYIHPDYRNLKASQLMVESFTKEMKDKGCKSVKFGNLQKFDKFDVFYRRMGFTHYESSYIKEIE